MEGLGQRPLIGRTRANLTQLLGGMRHGEQLHGDLPEMGYLLLRLVADRLVRDEVVVYIS